MVTAYGGKIPADEMGLLVGMFCDDPLLEKLTKNGKISSKLAINPIFGQIRAIFTFDRCSKMTCV